MKKWLIIGSTVGIVALVGTLVWSAVAFAQGPQGNFFGRGGFGGGPAFFGRAGFMNKGDFGRGGFGGSIDHEALLAEALGITVEELQAAQEEAHANAIQQAVDEGLITEEEADLMTSRLELRTYLDREALTAEALGITLEELQQAQDEDKPLAVLIYELDLEPATVRTNMQTAYENGVQQAVSDGVISQDQADQILEGPGFGGRGFGRFGGHRGFDGPGGFGRR